jgi:hypothetical protein
MSQRQENTHQVKKALQLLREYHTDPSSLMIRLQRSPSLMESFLDESTQTRWNFMVRRRSRLFLLAKPEDSFHYVDIHVMSTK